MGWLFYGVLVWMALAVFFWCLLVVAARADRRDADASPRDAGHAEPRITRRFVRGRRVARRHALGGLSAVRDEADEDLVERREHQL